MKCICPSCKLKLSAKRESLNKLKHPVFKCPNCQQIIRINPSKGKCGKCGSGFQYFDFMFPVHNAIAQCLNCNQMNKLLIKY